MTAARFLPLLRDLADLRTLLFVALALLLAAGNWTGQFRNLLSIPLACMSAFVSCTATHNQMHLPVFRSRFWNSIYQIAPRMNPALNHRTLNHRTLAGLLAERLRRPPISHAS